MGILERIITVFGWRREVKKIYLVTMAALCFFIIAKEVIIDGAPNILRALALHEPAPGQRKSPALGTLRYAV
jgi:hypothetical protein